MKHIIEDDYLNKNNILVSVEKMPNTETRYRLKIDERDENQNAKYTNT